MPQVNNIIHNYSKYTSTERTADDVSNSPVNMEIMIFYFSHIPTMYI